MSVYPMFGVSYFCVPISMLLYKWGGTLLGIIIMMFIIILFFFAHIMIITIGTFLSIFLLLNL